MEALNTFTLWLMNISGMVLWGYVLILSIESLGKERFITWVPWRDWKYWINWIWLCTSLAVVLYRVDDIWMQTNIHYQWIRSIASILCPVGIMIHYLLKGIRSSVLAAVSDFWKGKEYDI